MFANIRNVTLFFDVDGMALQPVGDRMVERPVLFLLHGGPGGDHSGFKRSIAELRDTAQLVFIDHRGSGRSTADPATWTLEHNIEDVEALRAHLGLERIAVLGHSYGGMVAQGYAIRYPNRLSHLVLSATAPSFRFLAEARAYIERHGTLEQQRVCERLWSGTFTSSEQLHEYYRVMGPVYARSFDAHQFEDQWRCSRRNFRQLNLGFGGFLRSFDFTGELHRIACPTLVLAGAHDWICPPSQAEVMAQVIPHAQLKVLADSAHEMSADEPKAYLATVRAFLEPIAAQAPAEDRACALPAVDQDGSRRRR